MNIGKILTTVGMGILKNVIPGVGIVVDTVNAFLPDDKKISPDSTGQQAINAINSLSPDLQAQVFSKQLDVEIVEVQEYTKVISALAEADKTGNSTRPAIALMMARVTAFAIVISVTVWAYAVMMNLVSMMTQLKESWPLLVAILGTPTALLRAYFAMRTGEKKARYNMSQNKLPETNGLAGLVNGVTGLFKK